MNPTQEKQPKVGDVKGTSGGTTLYYTKNNLPQPKASTATPVITPDALKAPATPTVSVPKEPVQAATMLGEIGAGADAFTQQLTEQKTQAESTKNTALSEYINSLKNMQGPAALTSQAYNKAGVDTIQTELSTINNQILQEQQALKRGVDRIQSQGGGLKIGAQAEIANLERASLAKQADLYVIQMGVQGRYDAAKAAADRAVDAQLEQQKIYNEALRFDYEESKDIFTTAEQREFETLLSNRKRALEEAAQTKKDIKALGLQALADGAPQDVASAMMNAKTLDEAVAMGGRYVGLLDRQAKQASIAASNASLQKTNAEIAALEKTATGSSNIAVQAFDSFSGSLNENNREQYTMALSNAVARGSVEQTEIALKTAAQAAAGKALTEDVVKRDQAIGALNDVKKALSDYEAAGGNTNLLTGGYEDLQNKLGKTSDPKLAAIESRINLALNSYTNAVSGASFTPQESARYAALFPSTSNTSQLNTSKIDTLLQTFEANNQVFYGNFYGGATPSQIAQQAVYEELIANATPEQLAELGIGQ